MSSAGLPSSDPSASANPAQVDDPAQVDQVDLDVEERKKDLANKANKWIEGKQQSERKEENGVDKGNQQSEREGINILR
jgi:hypothetical protein